MPYLSLHPISKSNKKNNESKTPLKRQRLSSEAEDLLQDSFYIKKNVDTPPLISSLNLTNMKRPSKNIATITMLNGILTINQSDDGLKIVDFASLDSVDMTPFKAMCLVQGMRNGDLYITETVTLPSPKRNPHPFIGKYITITRRDDGTLRPNFRPVSMGPDFNPATYASNVAKELLQSLSILLEK